MLIEYPSLKELTIVILTYNRSEYVLRNMQYWSGRGPQVIVLDGSLNCGIETDLISQLKDNIHYYYLPVSILKRLMFSFNLIKTEYVALLGDDEFHLPSGLVASIKELEKDPSLVACMGRALGFGIESACSENGLDGNVEILTSTQYSELEDYSIDDASAGERMFNHMKRYTCSTIYSVVRRDVWCNSFKVFLRHEFPVYGIAELQFELSVCYLGKSKIIPVLHWLRSLENLPVEDSTDISLNRVNTFAGLWNEGDKAEFRSKFLAITSEILASFDGRDKEVVSKEIMKAMDAYCIKPEQGPINHPCILKIKIVLKRKVLEPALSYLHVLHRLLFPRRAEKELEKKGVLVNYKELNEIFNLVRNFHTNNEKTIL